MVASKLYPELRIDVQPSPETNDHEVRFFVDGDDIIARFWKDMMGLDPDDILVAPCPLYASQPHKATLARCSCGVIGCGIIEVNIERSGDEVRWSWGDAESQQAVSFLAASYDKELGRALTDTSWETPDRTAARLLANQVDRQTLASHGLTFTWGSGRVRQGAFSVALRLEPGPYQVLVHLPWIGEAPELIARKCAELLREPPTEWLGAEWFAQQVNLGPPSLLGSGWRRGDS
jgi:hypothetical protein